MRIIALLAASFSALAAATPTPRSGPDDFDIAVLNFELSLAQLENAFYEEALHKFSEADFVKAGLPHYAHSRFLQTQHHERVHEAFLTEAIKAAHEPTVQACGYQFWLDDPKLFAKTALDIATIVEGAYIGAFGLLEKKDYRAIDGSILGVKARHASWINSAILSQNPWNTAFDTPLTPRQTWTLLSHFVHSYPPENAHLLPPHTTDFFPRLELVGQLRPGEKGQVKFLGVESCAEKLLHVVFRSGFSEFPAKLEKDGFFVVPKEIDYTGATFVYVTHDDKPVSDENIVAGPALYTFDFTSYDF